MTELVVGCKGSTGHHRIVTYDFGGLKMVVRFKVDACLPSTKEQSTATRSSPPSSSGPEAGSDDGDDLASILSNLAIRPVTSFANPMEVDIIWRGVHVPQSSLIEMTTRSELSAQRFDWAETYPQLYLSQTPSHYLAVHNKGQFSRVIKRQIGQGDLVRIEKEAQSGWRKIKSVLEIIQRLVIRYGLEGRISLVCVDGVLKVYKRSVRDSFLPDKLLALFDQKY